MSSAATRSGRFRGHLRRPRPVLGVAVGAVCVSASAVLVGLAHASPGTTSFYRCLLALPPLLVLAVRERRVAGAPGRRAQVCALVAGALFAGDMLLWTQAIFEVGAGLSTVLVNLQVVLVPILGWLVDRERVGGRFLAALPVMLIGVVCTAGVFEHPHGGGAPVSGTVHAVLAAVCYSGFLFLLRRGGADGRPLRSYALVTVAAAVVSLAVGAVWHGVDLAPGWVPLAWLLIAAVCGQVIGWLLVAVLSPRLSHQVGAVLLLLTPVGAVLLGAIVLAERPSALQALGCVLILAGAALATRSGRHTERGLGGKRDLEPVAHQR